MLNSNNSFILDLRFHFEPFKWSFIADVEAEDSYTLFKHLNIVCSFLLALFNAVFIYIIIYLFLNLFMHLLFVFAGTLNSDLPG